MLLAGCLVLELLTAELADVNLDPVNKMIVPVKFLPVAENLITLLAVVLSIGIWLTFGSSFGALPLSFNVLTLDKLI